MMYISYYITLFLVICVSKISAQGFRQGGGGDGMGSFIEDLLTNLFQERDVENQREPFSRNSARSNKPKRYCTKYPDPGRCDGREIMFYYDPFALHCRRFVYSGCGGNKNRFDTFEECNDVCNIAVYEDSLLQSDLPRRTSRVRDREDGGFLNGDGPFGINPKKFQGFGQLGVGFLRALRTPGPYRGSFGICTPETCPQFYERVDKFKDNLDDRLVDIETAGEISKKEGGTAFLKEVFLNRKNNRNNNSGGRSGGSSRVSSAQAAANRKTIDYYDTNDE